MSVLQASLLDLLGEPGTGDLGRLAERRELGRGAFVDVARGFLVGSSELFWRLEEAVEWRAERRRMYDRVLDVPRLVSFYGEGLALPDPLLDEMMEVLNDHYARELPDPLATVGLCLYRDGSDSVAWHGDTIGRGATSDTLVAICSLGAERRLALRPRGGGQAMAFDLSSGDLLVMGGSCQRTFEHSVPKTARPVGPRMSVQFRQAGVR